MVPVTKTFLPPIEEYTAYVQRAFNNNWLTNRGELVLELEEKLKKELNISNILVTNNGTIPLQIALKLLAKGGDVITTPYSYVASTSSILWENCKPVFVDIHPQYLTIDESKIEAAITDNTTCILATHVYGNPCNIEEIDRIAKKHNLKVIYDAAHCFGVKYKGKSIFEYGDVSTCSFHATKIFHTAEGGAFFTKDIDLLDKAFLSHAFGHKGDVYFQVGVNGKMSELSAAMGLAVLKYSDDIKDKRKGVVDYYLSSIKFSIITNLRIREGTEWNYSYYPILFDTENQMLLIKSRLEEKGVFTRRYFYPSLNNLPFLKESNNCEISENIASRVLCLPCYYELSEKDQSLIVSIINEL
jgi:dTDP-4-amino-4,6-dideoxygalactose transaminase